MTKYDRHIFLYAKGHYKRNDLIKDMKKIIEKRNGIDVEYITCNDIIDNLSNIAWNYINTEYQFLGFINDINPVNNSIFTSTPYNFEESIISKCLSILKFQKVVDIPFELGKPDPDILPLSKKD